MVTGLLASNMYQMTNQSSLIFEMRPTTDEMRIQLQKSWSMALSDPYMIQPLKGTSQKNFDGSWKTTLVNFYVNTILHNTFYNWRLQIIGWGVENIPWVSTFILFFLRLYGLSRWFICLRQKDPPSLCYAILLSPEISLWLPDWKKNSQIL